MVHKVSTKLFEPVLILNPENYSVLYMKQAYRVANLVSETKYVKFDIHKILFHRSLFITFTNLFHMLPHSSEGIELGLT